MRDERGFSLIELIIYMGIAGAGVYVAFTLWGAERFASREQTDLLFRSSAVSETLSVLADDLRDAARVTPRQSGPGALVFFPDGSTAVWFDRPDEPGVLYRKIVMPGGAVERERVVARRIDGLTVTNEGALVNARARSGAIDRPITVRRRP